MPAGVNTEAEAAMEAAMAVLNSGAPDSLEQGVKSIEHAAALGSGAALTRLAYFKAAGIGQKPDWDLAVDLLRDAAEVGWAPALDELRLLAGGGESPSEMRQRVDIRALIAPRRTEVVSTAPRMRIVRGFMSAGECAWLIERGRPRLDRAQVYDMEKEGSTTVPERSNSGAPFRLLDIDLVLIFLHTRIGHTIGMPTECFEPSYLLHYAPGEQFVAHVDYLDADKPGLAANIAQRGQRVATFLVYLNEEYEGGETAFPRLNYKFKGRTGDAFVFANVDPELKPDERTLHAGMAPTSGEKWLLSQWIRNRPAT